VFFAPRDEPKIAGVILLEHGMHGPNAASVARHVLDTFFAKQDGMPLPPAPTDLHLQIDDDAPRRSVPREDDPEPQIIANGSNPPNLSNSSNLSNPSNP